MSTNATPAQESAGTTDAPTTDRQTIPVFGIDAEGRRHRWGRHFDRIVVTDGDGTTIHAEGITDETPTELRCETTGRTFEVPATVAEWVQFIDDASAWVGTWLDAETAPEAIRRHEAAEAELEDTA